MLIFSISHHVYLDREQRYKLINRENVSAMGVSVPVWVKNNGASTEPAIEVMCNYDLYNNEDKKPIRFKANGYEITLPKPSEVDANLPGISNEIWRLFTDQERRDYYEGLPDTPNINRLRDISEGGGESIKFREHNKIYQDQESLEVYHYVHIDDISRLKNSLN